MKVKTSITLSDNLLVAIDQMLDKFKNRSNFLETAAWNYIAKLDREERDTRDIALINQRADELNAETMEILEYQVPL